MIRIRTFDFSTDLAVGSSTNQAAHNLFLSTEIKV